MKAIVIGAGQLGSRHAQSLAKLDGMDCIVLIDPSEASLDLAELRILEVGFHGEIRKLTKLEHQIRGVSLAVVSTSSKHRLSATRAIQEWSDSKTVLLEKLLAPNLKELAELAATVRGDYREYWVNCPMPYFEHYSLISSTLEMAGGDGPVSYEVQASNLGLVTNSIHYLDHFARLLPDELSLSVDFCGELDLISSKRRGYSELTGEFSATTVRGDSLRVSFGPTQLEGEFLKIRIAGGRYVWEIDELNNKLLELIDGLQSTEATISTPRQSDLTHVSASLIAAGQQPYWSTFDQSARLHGKILSALERSGSSSEGTVFT